MKPDQARGELPDVANEVHQGRVEGTDDDRLDAPLDSENKVTETDMLTATDTTFDVPPNKTDAAAAMEADAAMEVDAAAMLPCIPTVLLMQTRLWSNLVCYLLLSFRLCSTSTRSPNWLNLGLSLLSPMVFRDTD